MRAFQVFGTSMWPVLKDGDWVLVVDGVEPKVGDIVIREIDGAAIAHRVLDSGITKGDRFLIGDPPIDLNTHPAALAEMKLVTLIFPRRAVKPGPDSRFVPAQEPANLHKWQQRLSSLQMTSKNRLYARVLQVLLILNGFAIRAFYYGYAVGAPYVARKSRK